MIAGQVFDLHEVFYCAKREGWSYLTSDGTLIHIDRVGEPMTTAGIHGRIRANRTQLVGNVQIAA